VLAQEIIEEAGPIPEPASKIGGGFRPVQLVTPADVDPFDLDAAPAHGRCELMEQWAWRPLKEQERAAVRRVKLGPSPLRRGIVGRVRGTQ